MEFLIANKSHVSDIFEMEKEIFADMYSQSAVLDMILNENYRYIVAVDEKVRGYVGVSIVLDECDITHMAVEHEYRGKKIGQKLLSTLMDFAKQNDIAKIHLEVRESNEKARNLYTKVGFLEVGMRKNYYRNPSEHAILMTLNIK